MSFKKKIIKNIGFVSMGEAVSGLLSYFLIVYIARILGSEGLGIYSFVYAFAGLFVVFYDFGISTFFIREVSSNRENAKKYFGYYASLKLIFCIVTMVIPIIMLPFLKRSFDVNIMIILASLSFFFQNYSWAARNTFQAYQQMWYDSLVRIVERIVAFALGWYVLSEGYGLKAFLLVLVASNLVSLVTSIVLLKKLGVEFRLKADRRIWQDILKVSWPFWLSVVFVQIYFQVDTVMLSFMKGYEATGLYNAAYKLINVIVKIPWIVVLVLFPVMSELHGKLSKDLLKKVLEKGAHAMIVLSFPLIVGTTILAQRIIGFIYKQGFSDSVIVLQILVCTTSFLFLSNLIGWFLNAVDMQKIFTYTTGVSLLINVLLNIILIPSLSYVGTSIATVATSCINFMLLYYFSSKKGYSINLPKLMARPLVSSIAMGAFIIFFGKGMHLLALVPISALIYFASLLILGDIKKEDIAGIF